MAPARTAQTVGNSVTRDSSLRAEGRRREETGRAEGRRRDEGGRVDYRSPERIESVPPVSRVPSSMKKTQPATNASPGSALSSLLSPDSVLNKKDAALEEYKRSYRGTSLESSAKEHSGSPARVQGRREPSAESRRTGSKWDLEESGEIKGLQSSDTPQFV